jgi:hypothetical protein
VVPYSQADCPYPLKFNPKGRIADPTKPLGSLDQICVYPCPDPMFTDDDWDAAFGVLTSLASTTSPRLSLCAFVRHMQAPALG